MRKSLLVCLATLFYLCLTNSGSAQDEELVRPRKPQKPKIEKVRYGFVGGVNRGSTAYGDFKAGCWTPIYVDVLAGSEDLPNGSIVIEGTDADDVKFKYRVPLPHLEKGKSHIAVGYTKPSALHTNINIILEAGDKQIADRKETPNSLGVGHVLYLALGARVQGLAQAFLDPAKAGPVPPGGNENALQINAKETKGRYVAYLDDTKQLPKRWFGYESADVVLLLTGDRNFITDVLNDHQVNKDASAYAALAEWVRRGGRLVVFAGRNHDVMAQLDERQPLLPVRLMGANPDAEAGRLNFTRYSPKMGDPPPGLHITQFVPKPAHDYRLLVGPNLKQSFAVQGRHGLGQVTVFGFDPEQAPFTRGAKHTEFWRAFLETQKQEGLEAPPEYQQASGGFYPGGTPELGAQLQQMLEEFQDVPVISFGWVALFILLYILIVGPLDYFFLKKVVKRLEFTWITFPLVVLVISAVAYFTAYYVKGSDLRINKVDLVDIDVQGKQAQVYGQTWFTLFSPRIQHYTVGLEPAADTGWAPREGTAVALSWLGRPDNSMMGYGRSGSQTLFRRTYEFEPDLSGIRGVPIPVWSTKSFIGSWMATQPMQGLIEADVHIEGHITSHLPVALTAAALVWHDGTKLVMKDLDTLVPDARLPLGNVLKAGEGKPLSSELLSWAGKAPQVPIAGRPGANRQAYSSTSQTMAELFFNRQVQTQGNTRRNSGMRQLDQSWRLVAPSKVNPGQAILIGRVERLEQGAESVTSDPCSPSRLWLGQLPKQGATRPPLSGTLSQETYVRVFLPMRKTSE